MGTWVQFSACLGNRQVGCGDRCGSTFNTLYATPGGAYNPWDAFEEKVTADGSRLAYASYIGGDGPDCGFQKLWPVLSGEDGRLRKGG